MDHTHDLYIKKHQEIFASYERMADKLSSEFVSSRKKIDLERDAALAAIDPRLRDTDVDAFVAALNSIFKTHSEKVQKITDEFENAYQRITIMYEHNKRLIDAAYAKANADYARNLESLNNQTAAKLGALAEVTIEPIGPRVPRISTISSAR
jgi:predicted component of viral defense system (DUF524 family)